MARSLRHLAEAERREPPIDPQSWTEVLWDQRLCSTSLGGGGPLPPAERGRRRAPAAYFMTQTWAASAPPCRVNRRTPPPVALWMQMSDPGGRDLRREAKQLAPATARPTLVGRSDGHPWGDLLAISGEFRRHLREDFHGCRDRGRSAMCRVAADSWRLGRRLRAPSASIVPRSGGGPTSQRQAR